MKPTIIRSLSNISFIAILFLQSIAVTHGLTLTFPILTDPKTEINETKAHTVELTPIMGVRFERDNISSYQTTSSTLCIAPRDEIGDNGMFNSPSTPSAYSYPSESFLRTHEDLARNLFVGKKLATGTIGQEEIFGRFIGMNTRIAHLCNPTFHGGWHTELTRQLSCDDTLTYRVQYPAGTVIRAVGDNYFRGTIEKTILSNYSTTNTPLIAWNGIDPFIAETSRCTTTSIKATLLDGTTKELFDARKDFWQENPEKNEYFAIPNNTATLTFSFESIK